MAGLTFRGLAKITGNLGVALDIGDFREVEIATVRLRFAGRRGLEIFVGLGSFQLPAILL